ncbi:MAG: hypothetical protein C5B55_02575 [Blastocatellia bacterium]|nr:MAG: hypothetical protein C5B55_02575 [Blastocatellia bacterium]
MLATSITTTTKAQSLVRVHRIIMRTCLTRLYVSISVGRNNHNQYVCKREHRSMAMRKILVITVITIALILLGIVSVGASTKKHKKVVADFDAAATYKSKCVSCHGAKADKKFDATKADDDLVQVILKGKKAEKPPNMPEYESKGITADQAKALVTLMKSLKA